MISIFIIVHLALWGVWKLVAERERTTRTDGSRIPRYMTSDVGNPVGFTLVATAVGMAAALPSVTALVIAGVAALGICAVLNRMWTKAGKRRTVSLYLRSGAATPAGKLHLVYVWFVSVQVIIGLLLWGDLTPTAQVLFVGGVLWYSATVVIDHLRGVI